MWLSGDEQADALLAQDPLALLIGMLLDQQFPMERAFQGPFVLLQRLDAAAGRSGEAASGRLDPLELANYEPQALADLMSETPAVHRYPSSMAGRVQGLSAAVVADYGGDAAAVWSEVPDAHDVLARLKALPGYGDRKAKIMVALLGKQFEVRPDGWRQVSAPFGEAGSRLSIADVTGPETLVEVREAKKAAKRAARST